MKPKPNPEVLKLGLVSFKRFLVPAGVFALGCCSLGFLLLKAHEVGFSLTDTVLLYALFNAVCVGLATLLTVAAIALFRPLDPAQDVSRSKGIVSRGAA